MRRRLLNLLTVLSLLLFVTACVFWVRSDSVFHDLRYVRPIGRTDWWGCSVSSAAGRIYLGYVYHSAPANAVAPTGGWRFDAEEGNGRLWGWAMAYLAQMSQFGHQWLGFGVLDQEGIPVHGDVESVRAVMAPYWFLACCLASPPLLSVPRVARHLRGAHRGRKGHCRKCGYDLRATPGRCPECGAAAAALPNLVDPVSQRR